ncbi:MAG TPA: tripartite tricarboxylate transporter TctB family protein [Albitalea sp.]|nr:tripartite tricarboxylate transporter TctB family protein [Albitalea sp.]
MEQPVTPGGSSPRSDLFGGAAWIVFGLLIVAESLRMDRFTAMGATLYTMPGLVPGLFGGLLMVLGLALAWRGWRHRAAQRHETPPAARMLNRRVLTMLAITLPYAIGLVGRVPFTLATCLFVAAFTWLFTPPDATTMRRVVAAIASGVLTTAAIVLVFEQIFLVRLP